MTRDNRIRFAFLASVASSMLPLLPGCATEPDTGEVSQELGACPWAPPQPCWPALWGENGRCNNLCLEFAGMTMDRRTTSASTWVTSGRKP